MSKGITAMHSIDRVRSVLCNLDCLRLLLSMCINDAEEIECEDLLNGLERAGVTLTCDQIRELESAINLYRLISQEGAVDRSNLAATVTECIKQVYSSLGI